MRPQKLVCTILALVFFAVATISAQAQEAAIIDLDAIHHPAIARHGMVVSQEALASRVGVDILKAGGNAVDAAVAAGFALSATLPRAGNIGGGGFMLVHLQEQNKTIAIDYRETAPAAAHEKLFQDEQGNVIPGKSRFSHASSGVPGTVAGLTMVLEKYGTMSLKDVMAPAISLAEKGFVVTDDFYNVVTKRGERLKGNPASRAKFFHKDGSRYQVGDIFRQKDLARSLKLVARHGAKAFYEGEIAERIAADMARNGGLITLADLKNYRAIEREPLQGEYHGYRIATMPPPSSGGVHILQMLNILDHFPLKDWGFGSANTIHIMAETMKLAYADRSKYLGDPDYFKVPVKGLVSPDYAAILAKSIDLKHARPSSEIAPGTPHRYESPNTTHFSVMDSHGNAVANTYTLNFSFGSGITIPGTGILMNNEMDDFSSKPGVANAFGLLGGEANKIEGGKRPLSSMTPTIAFHNDKPFLVTGSPGGSTIITIVLQTLINVIDHNMNIADAAAAPRIHHQWYPDQIYMEPGFSPDTINILKSRGHHIGTGRVMGATQSVMWMDGIYYGAADPRRPASEAAGY